MYVKYQFIYIFQYFYSIKIVENSQNYKIILVCMFSAHMFSKSKKKKKSPLTTHGVQLCESLGKNQSVRKNFNFLRLI